jgi:hypothetical protein
MSTGLVRKASSDLVHTGATHSTGHWPRMPPRRCPCTRRFDTTLKLYINIFCEAFTRRGWADKRSLSHADHLPCCRRMRATQRGDERTPELRTRWVLVAFLGSDGPVRRSPLLLKPSIFHRIYVGNAKLLRIVAAQKLNIQYIFQYIFRQFSASSSPNAKRWKGHAI